LENFRTASNAGMPYVIPFDSAVFFFSIPLTETKLRL
jgi:hypothetical protein